MEIDLTELTAQGVRIDERFDGDALASEAARERAAPVEARLTAWVRPEAGGARATGEMAATVRAECDRCLKPVEVAIDGEFDQRYVWGEEVDTAPNMLVDADALDVERLDAPVLDTRALAREQIELNAPIRVVCSEGCAGLCPICRADRNVTDCGCEQGPADPRWDALKDLKIQ